jgi:hypothetical protein
MWKLLEIKCEKIILSSINKWLYTPKRMERISEGISHKKMPHTKNIFSSSFPKHINTPYKKKNTFSKKNTNNSWLIPTKRKGKKKYKYKESPLSWKKGDQPFSSSINSHHPSTT